MNGSHASEREDVRRLWSPAGHGRLGNSHRSDTSLEGQNSLRAGLEGSKNPLRERSFAKGLIHRFGALHRVEVGLGNPHLLRLKLLSGKQLRGEVGVRGESLGRSQLLLRRWKISGGVEVLRAKSGGLCFLSGRNRVVEESTVHLEEDGHLEVQP